MKRLVRAQRTGRSAHGPGPAPARRGTRAVHRGLITMAVCVMSGGSAAAARGDEVIVPPGSSQGVVWSAPAGAWHAVGGCATFSRLGDEWWTEAQPGSPARSFRWQAQGLTVGAWYAAVPWTTICNASSTRATFRLRATCENTGAPWIPNPACAGPDFGRDARTFIIDQEHTNGWQVRDRDGLPLPPVLVGPAGAATVTLQNTGDRLGQRAAAGSMRFLRLSRLPRDPRLTAPIVFVRGLAPTNDGIDCPTRWGRLIALLRARGWTGEAVTVQLYHGDRRCTLPVADGDNNIPIPDLARALARRLAARFGAGQPLDVVTQSLGGLVVRRAMVGVAAREAGYPARLSVEDVVTLGAPHAGSNAAWTCAAWSEQCRELLPGSALLRYLAGAGRHPQDSDGTDWTTIGSVADRFVDPGSATAMAADHKYVLLDRPHGVGHQDYMDEDSLALDQSLRRSDGGRPYVREGGQAHTGILVENALAWGDW